MWKSLKTAMALVLIMAATVAMAEDASGKKETQTKTGVVKSVDLTAKTIVVLVARELTFSVPADAKILQGSVPKMLADIKVGATVTVDYSTPSKDNRVASKVVIGAAGTSAAPGASTK